MKWGREQDLVLLLFIVVFDFGAVVASLAGSISALVMIAQKARRSWVNFAMSLAAVLATLALETYAVVTARRDRWVTREDMLLFVAASAPVFWVGVTATGMFLRPGWPHVPTPESASNKGERVAIALAVATLAYMLVVFGVYFALPPRQHL